MRLSEFISPDDRILLEHQIEQALAEAGFLNKLKGIAAAGVLGASMLGAAGNSAASQDNKQVADKPAATAQADAASNQFGSKPNKWSEVFSKDVKDAGMPNSRMSFVYDQNNILKPAPGAVGLLMTAQLYQKTTNKSGGERMLQDGTKDTQLIIFHLGQKKFAVAKQGGLEWKSVPADGPFAEAFKVAQQIGG